VQYPALVTEYTRKRRGVVEQRVDLPPQTPTSRSFIGTNDEFVAWVNARVAEGYAVMAIREARLGAGDPPDPPDLLFVVVDDERGVVASRPT
jgi:hypothetical protein